MGSRTQGKLGRLCRGGSPVRLAAAWRIPTAAGVGGGVYLLEVRVRPTDRCQAPRTASCPESVFIGAVILEPSRREAEGGCRWVCETRSLGGGDGSGVI